MELQWTELKDSFIYKEEKGMGGFFSIDGKGFRFLSTMSELVTLNLLWLLCCIPIVTIGASTAALYTITIKMVKNEDSYVIRGFFSSFKQNFKQATTIWMILLAAAAVLFFDFYFSSYAPVKGAAVLFVPFATAAALLVLVMIYVFPIQAVFKNTVWKTLKNSLYMALAYLPLSILAFVIAMGPLAVLFLFLDHFGSALFFNCVIGVAFFTWTNSHIFVKVFDRYMV